MSETRERVGSKIALFKDRDALGLEMCVRGLRHMRGNLVLGARFLYSSSGGTCQEMKFAKKAQAS